MMTQGVEDVVAPPSSRSVARLVQKQALRRRNLSSRQTREESVSSRPQPANDLVTTMFAAVVGAASEVLAHYCEALILLWMRTIAIQLGDLLLGAYPWCCDASVVSAWSPTSTPERDVHRNEMNVSTRRYASCS
jgi:hypothetical protein